MAFPLKHSYTKRKGGFPPGTTVSSRTKTARIRTS